MVWVVCVGVVCGGCVMELCGEGLCVVCVCVEISVQAKTTRLPTLCVTNRVEPSGHLRSRVLHHSSYQFSHFCHISTVARATPGPLPVFISASAANVSVPPPLCDRVEPSLVFTFVALWVREAVSAVREESFRPLLPVWRIFVIHPQMLGRVSSL